VRQVSVLAHDEAVRLVAKAVSALEQGEYAAAAKNATKAAYNLQRRVEIGEGDGHKGRDDTPRWKDALALAKARTVVVAAMVRANAAVDAQGRAVPLEHRSRVHDDAYKRILQVRKSHPKLGFAKEVEAELEVRSGNLKDGKRTLLALAAADVLSAPEA
jgi:hypothetical protein